MVTKKAMTAMPHMVPAMTTTMTPPSNSHTGTKHAAIRQRMKEQQGSGKLWKSQARKVFAVGSQSQQLNSATSGGSQVDEETDEFPVVGDCRDYE
jgi:hypothetical protein